MSESAGERTEAATPKRREEAKQKGQIPRSQDLSMAVMLLGSALVLNLTAAGLAGMVRSVFEFGLIVTGAGAMDASSSITLLQTLGWKVLGGIASFVACMAAIGVCINGVQARGVLTLQPLSPQWSRLSPATNARRMLGAQPWVELAKSLLKLGVVGVVVHGAFRDAWPSAMALAQQGPFAFLAVLRGLAVKMLATAGAAYLALAGADYLYQLWKHDRELRMSRQEVKEEHKQSEGDPLIKAQRQALGRSRARRQMFQEVPRADVVITNPTHIAVALRYDPAENNAPIVLAMGQRKIAERIKAIAREAGVPTVENKPVARALLASARVGDTIPAELYLAVAEVLAFVIRQRKVRTPAWRGSAEA